ncbi:MAG: antibiotic biosynthesis monooxygenase [Gemmatimonadota bacterium]
MISRHWTCVTHPESAADYERYLRTQMFKAMEKIDGFRSAVILRRDTPEGLVYRVVTEWASMDAIRAFAGEDVETAVVPEKVRPWMIRFDDRVVHYEVR